MKSGSWLLASAILALTACSPADRAGSPVAYAPRTRNITVTTVPLLVKEAQGVYPFLKPAFAKGGVLEGKEVYAFTVTHTFPNAVPDAR